MMRGTLYVVIPHPDDEGSVLGLLQAARRFGSYLVLAVMTQGEATSHCSPSDDCARMRIDSWHGFLDDLGYRASAPVRRDGFDLRVGSDHARMVFDLGDGQLTSTETSQAIDSMLSEDLPVKNPGWLVAGGYLNLHGEHHGSREYSHRDHVAVHEAVLSHPSKMGRVIRTPTTAPRVDTTFEVEDFDAIISHPDGPWHRHYGWLARDGRWSLGEDDSDPESRSGFVRYQSFECHRSR